MSSYYDEELSSYLDTIKMKDFTIISEINSIVELMMKNFHFENGRVCFKSLKNEKYIKSDSSNISKNVVSFINELISEKVCNINEKVIYIGDDLTEYGYEFYLYDLLKVIPYLVNELPQHHYFLFSDRNRLMYVSFENEIQFGRV